MLKKLASNIFVLLANVVVLMHVVVPHHHHQQQQVCIQSTHCQDNSSEHEHKHDGNSANTCVLKQLVVGINNQSRNECLCGAPTQFHAYEAIFSLFNQGATNYQEKLKLSYTVSNAVPIHSRLLTSPSGLRAPPAVS